MDSEIQEIPDHNNKVETQQTLHGEGPSEKEKPVYLEKFKLYETYSVFGVHFDGHLFWSHRIPQHIRISLKQHFYMIGQDKSGSVWRVLKVSRSEPSELNIFEDSTMYSKGEYRELKKRIHYGNMSTGGLKLVTTCYGIVGFVKFLGPYYMLLITGRSEIGVICGHAIYAITESKLISISNTTMQSNIAYSKYENRYKKLLCTVDLKKDFFFSYSYHVMHTLQMNMSGHNAGQVLYESMFVWNEWMTRGIRNHLQNTLWTVALVHGFFKQINLQISGKCFKLTLIARRSRHHAGTRYLKRGVNEEGQVANDVETEQIVFKDVCDGCIQISSVVQHRGSIPLFWSQKSSPFNIKPDMILSKKDLKYEVTRLHFQNLAKRYGNPIIIFNLIKSHERRPRESILGTEFKNAIDSINRELPVEDQLKFLHWDLSKFNQSRKKGVLLMLAKMAAHALKLTGIFYCLAHPSSRRKETFNWLSFENCKGNNCTVQKSECCCLKDIVGTDDVSESNLIKTSLQKGVLRTNCIDCLDRTNVGQFAYGLVAFGLQLHALGLQDTPNIDLGSPLEDDLLRLYEMMGDALAFQYGGSSAHNKIFCDRRGQWKAVTRSQEIFRSLQRYYSNAYQDAEKQDAINVFLGNFQSHQGKLELWDIDLDKHYNIGNQSSNFSEENSRSAINRSLSDGTFLNKSNSPTENENASKHDKRIPASPDKIQDGIKVYSESAPEILTRKSQASYCRQLFPNVHPEEELFGYSNFLVLDWHSLFENSCEEELSTLENPPDIVLSSDSVINELRFGANTSQSGCSVQGKDLNNDAACSFNILADFSSYFARLMERCCSL